MESNQPVSPAPAPASGNEKTMAIASLVLGVINLCAWFFPLCGIPLALVGIVLGYFGMKDIPSKNLAIAGIALSAFSLLLACGNAALGAYWAATGQSGFDFNF
ncbi:MAG TPA: DUF4190 domain-containing protein [Anaerolineae bacterium]|nr:DUF4190 domain-containing protein [Anaerolineae bacterium]HRJ75578.1 DUF4190 domain-containing protein [Anaerolineales bacterium]